MYQKKLIQRLLASYETNIDFKFSLLDGLILLKRSWELVSEETIKNCFTHVRFFREEKVLSAKTLVYSQEIDQSFNQLKCILNFDVEIKEFIEIDNDSQTTAELSISNIVESVLPTSYGINEEIDNEKTDEEN